MKTSPHPLRLTLSLTTLLAMALPGLAVTFTNDTFITLNNTNYDDQEIVVSNCTLTVDGTHAFAAIHILNGGTLTHSFATNGLLQNLLSIQAEPHVASATNPPALDQTNVLASTVVISDVSGTNIYLLGADYILSASNGVTQINLVPGSSIPDGATVSVSYSALQYVTTGLHLNVADNVEVEVGAAINVNATGFGDGNGPGRGASAAAAVPYRYVAGSGAGYGGFGGLASTLAVGGNCYGSVPTPSDLGSGGGYGSGSGGCGGGAISLTAGRRLRVNGQITANGADAQSPGSGGGSGGSIWLSAQTISGAGSISANGGAGEPFDGGGGGGGRIAVYFATNHFSGGQFAGRFSARGGSGSACGGAGTIYSKADSDDVAQLTVDNGGSPGTNTLITPPGWIDLTVAGCAIAQPASALSARNLLIASNSWTVCPPSQHLTLMVTSNATIQLGGGIGGDGRGYAGGQGPGAGLSYPTTPYGYTGGGAGYGGYGGTSITNATGGNAYGSASAPMDMGSGGGHGYDVSPYYLGGAGGGALTLNVAGTLFLYGTITANGSAGVGSGSGGGSGGSVYLTAGTLAGAGTISANGGSGDLPYGGGGGGGRVAAYFGTNAFTGRLLARGGPGANYGGAGTVYSKTNTSSVAQVLLDNAGRLATNTAAFTVPAPYDLTVSGGAVLDPSNLGTIRNLLLGSNSWLVPLARNPMRIVIPTIIGNATIQRDGGIVLDGRGYPAAQGTGAGRSATVSPGPGQTGGGAGYGGYGGNSAYSAAGGNSYGSINSPTDYGSGGGLGYAPTPFPGGSGGGALQMTVNGALQVDGRITADGLPAMTSGGGGGSGGSISLTAGVLTGSGIISANGGGGDLPYGGGGAGGRIAINSSSAQYRSNLFAGTLSARGGSGATCGAAGTIYSYFYATQHSQIIVDNGGQTGATTPWPSYAPASPDLAISNGASLVANAYSMYLGNLLIASNSWLSFTNYSSATLNVTGSATLQAGGGISLDRQGYPGGQGTGAGGSSAYPGAGNTGGGGGHAGFGGVSAFGARGGNAYDLVSSPAYPGSGGGAGIGAPPYNLGGPGGGALHLTVSGPLILDGRISADGGQGVGFGSGGGSGGSLWLTLGKISGAGVISANGGPGDLPYGGGGGGGRIAITCNTNQFNGTIAARGGVGATCGGAGTIYTKLNNSNAAQISMDNGGSRGTNTLLSVLGTSCDLTVTGGAIASPLAGAATIPLRNLLITSNSWMTLLPSNQTPNLILTLSGDATIQPGGGIVTDAKGYFTGPGRGGTLDPFSDGYTGGGGGYGGYGGAGHAGGYGGNSYGSLLQPADPGSGGGGYLLTTYGAPGGGAIQLIMSRGTLALNGTISANGAPAQFEGGGGGSGGGVWLTVNRLTGAGLISADGGPGDLPYGGGGGGGRIAIYYSTNQFAGPISARGAAGAVGGGAGTIYSQTTGSTTGQVIVDNGGLLGTNTPMPSIPPVDLTVIGAAVLHPSPSTLRLNSLIVDSGATVTHLVTQTNLDLTILGNAVVGTNGAISADGKGYSGSNGGPGSGSFPSGGSGSGGGYGGQGGASASGAVGGGIYGSASQPTDRGSRGGLYPLAPGFCEGGGAIRLRVAGTLTINGRLSANGNLALPESAGGGAGGSLWITARNLQGAGSLTANGGAGNPNEGGGGGGGRIAIESRTNTFTGASTALGGPGASPGSNGTVVFGDIPFPQVVAQTPSDIVSYAVSFVDFTFTSLMNMSSASPADFTVDTPDGFLPQSTLAVSSTNLSSLRLTFPPQTTLGYYEIQVRPQIEDIYGQTMAAPWFGSFIILPPIISGRVTSTNGLPVPYVTLQVQGDPVPTLTDTNGFYAVEVYPGWTGTITPSRTESVFIPPSRTYTNVSADFPNQNFVMAPPAALTLTADPQGPSLVLRWHGTTGLTYQPLYSTNLVDWYPCSTPLPGTNAPMSCTVPIGPEPLKFFRFTTND